MSPAAEPRRSAPVAEVLDDVRQGRFVVVMQDAGDQSLGTLVLAAQHVGHKELSFLCREGTGQFFLCLSDERCDQLGLAAIASGDEMAFRSALTQSITHRGADTSLAARAQTIRLAIDPGTDPTELVRPGWVLPARARPGGVLQRAELVEAAVDLARLAGLHPAAVIGVTTSEDGALRRGDDLRRYARLHGLRDITIDELIVQRRQTFQLVTRAVSVRLPTSFGQFTAVAFNETTRDAQHMALVKGEVGGAEDVLVRVHRGCRLGDVFGSSLCACGARLRLALSRIEQEGRGVVVYLIGAPNGFAGCSNDAGQTPLVGEGREYGIGAQILADLGLSTIRVLTDSLEPIEGVGGFGLRVAGRVRLDGAA